ncbi:MAG: cereblon family protein [Proteobacteria bacterium]|nr:cereblon family protein [Pseudomonadota bacterium]
MIDVVEGKRQALDPKLKALIDEEDEADRDFFFCRACSNVIGRLSDRMEIHSSFDHFFTNPYGYEFHVGCFREALGCTIAGDRVAADTWFMGFQWRHAMCSQCSSHLGWYFDNSDTYFYGLILDRIQHD